MRCIVVSRRRRSCRQPGLLLAVAAAAALSPARALQASVGSDGLNQTSEGMPRNGGSGNVAQWLPVEGLWFRHAERSGGVQNLTVIVTHAGMNRQEYLDSAVMLGLSLKRYIHGYPMVALGVKGMTEKSQRSLARAGWQVLLVDDWGAEHCGSNCSADIRFVGRWSDSFEKINAFRLPFGRVLFMDADTYLYSDSLGFLLNSTHVPDGHVAMVPDSCKEGYNSGVMLFKPNLQMFEKMLSLIATKRREEMLDQPIINEVYRGRVIELDRKYNCEDLMGRPPGLSRPCSKKCSEIVVAHFTGLPKPTRANERLLEIVRRPNGWQLDCNNTNWGACKKWSSYYCDMWDRTDYLSFPLVRMMKRAGTCCHSPVRADDSQSCQQCPREIEIKSPVMPWARGVFWQTNIRPGDRNGGRPIYVKKGTEAGEAAKPTVYMFWLRKLHTWMVGLNYSHYGGWMYASFDAACPRDAGQWLTAGINGSWRPNPNISVVLTSNADNISQDTLFDMGQRKWVPREGSWFDF